MKLPPEYRERQLGNIDWVLENGEEYEALHRAQDGDPFPLADLVAARGNLRTHEAREWIAARLRGEKLMQGGKRTMDQQVRDFIIWGEVRRISLDERVKEHRAIEILCDRDPDLNSDTVKTQVRRAKADWKKATGSRLGTGEGNPES